MENKELVEYIKECRKRGLSDSQIRSSLLEKNWEEKEIIEAMFKYAKPKTVPKGLFLAGLIVAGVIIIIMIGGTIFMLNDIGKISAETASLTKNLNKAANNDGVKTFTSTNIGFEVKYPSDILRLDEVKATLTHTLKNFHKYSLKDGSDLGLAEDIKIVFKKDADECDNADDTMEEIAEPFILGELRGLKYETGAEGEGMVLYCFRDDFGKNIFMIQRYFLSEVWSIELPKQADFIPSAKQAEIFDNILASFKLL